MKPTKTRIIRFSDDDFYIDIVEEEKTLEAWMQHKNFGISVLMYGLLKSDVSYNDFVAMVARDCKAYEQQYMEEYN